MPYDEFLGWVEYFEERPVEWRDDDRFSKILQSLGAKGKPWEYFPSLAPIYNKSKSEEEDESSCKLNVESFKNSAFLQMLQGSTGGAKVL